MGETFDVPEIGGQPGQFPRQGFMDYLHEKEARKHQIDSSVPGSSPKDVFAHALAEQSVRLDVLEVMVTKLLRDSGMSDEDVVAYLDIVFAQTPDTPEGLQP